MNRWDFEPGDVLEFISHDTHLVRDGGPYTVLDPVRTINGKLRMIGPRGGYFTAWWERAMALPSRASTRYLYHLQLRDDIKEQRQLASTREYGDLAGHPVHFHSQGGIIFLHGYGCRNCGNAFWTEDDDKRRLTPGTEAPCPHCGKRSKVPTKEATT